MSNSSRSGCELSVGFTQQVAHRTRDHQFLVGRDDPSGRAGPARNPGSPARVRDLVELKSSPCAATQNLRACRGVILADATGEDESVDAPEGSDERPHLPSDAVDEQVDRLSGLEVRRGQRSQLAHVVRDPGDTEQSTLCVEEALRLFRAELHLPQHVEDNAGIDRATARAHGQSVKRREAHRCGDACAIVKRTQAGTVAQMSNHDPSRGKSGVVVRENGRNVGVGEAMKAVAPHARFGHGAGQGEQLREIWLVAVKRGVEARDLWELGKSLSENSDRCQVVGLMKGRQRYELLKLSQDSLVDQHGRRERNTAVDDPVANRLQAIVAPVLADPGGQMSEGLLMPEWLALAPTHFARDLTSLASDHELGRAAEPVEQAPIDAPRLSDPASFKELELDARRPGVEHEGHGNHGSHLWKSELRPLGFGDQGRHRAGCEAGDLGVSAARQDDGHAGTQHDPGRIRIGQEGQAPGQHVAGFEVGDDKDVGLPATGDLMFLIWAAPRSMALSRARGPSRMPPVIWPRSAILQSAAASMVDGTFGFTVSMADRMATRTVSTPRAWARSMAFWTMSTLSSRVGAMLIAASVTIRAESWLGTSMTKQWLTRRAVLRPPSRRTTAAMSSSVWRLPFISASASPALTSATAFSAATWLWGASTMRNSERSALRLFAVAAILSCGPTRIGSMSPSEAASRTAPSEVASQGCATATFSRGRAFAAASSRSYFSCRRVSTNTGCDAFEDATMP